MKSILRLFLGAFAKYKTIFKYYVWDLKLSDVYLIKVINNEQYKFLNYGDITRVLFAKEHLVSQNSGFEYMTLKIYQNLLKNNFTVLDIGANIGLFSIIGSNKVGANGKIYAFEPIQKTFETLKQNLELNDIKNVVSFCLALSNRVGKVSFSIPKDIKNVETGDAFNAMDIEIINNPSANNQADCTQIDLFLKEEKIDKVDLIKIDIEGAELLCFQGAKELLGSSNPPIIIMECVEHLCSRFNYTVFDVLSYLHSFGYRFEQYETSQWLAIPNNSPIFKVKDLLK